MIAVEPVRIWFEDGEPPKPTPLQSRSGGG